MIMIITLKIFQYLNCARRVWFFPTILKVGVGHWDVVWTFHYIRLFFQKSQLIPLCFFDHLQVEASDQWRCVDQACFSSQQHPKKVTLTWGSRLDICYVRFGKVFFRVGLFILVQTWKFVSEPDSCLPSWCWPSRVSGRAIRQVHHDHRAVGQVHPGHRAVGQIPGWRAQGGRVRRHGREGVDGWPGSSFGVSFLF